jgi:hypothetical protein
MTNALGHHDTDLIKAVKSFATLLPECVSHHFNLVVLHQCRDTYIAFGLVSATYMFIGVTFYITFPLPKSCIEDVSSLTWFGVIGQQW